MKKYIINNNEFIFNGEAKGSQPRYTLNGKRLTGVTTALGVLNKPALLGWAAREAYSDCIGKDEAYIKTCIKDKNYAHTRKSDKAKEIGTDTHAIFETWVVSKINNTTYDGIKIPATEEAMAWTERENIKWLATEQSVVSSKYWYAGTFDALVEIDGEMWVVDLKTSSGIYGNEYWLQCSAYMNAIEEMKPENNIVGSIIFRVGKEAKKDGSNDVQIVKKRKDTRDFKSFLACLVIHREGEMQSWSNDEALITPASV